MIPRSAHAMGRGGVVRPGTDVDEGELEKVLWDVFEECAEAGSFGREEEDEIETERVA